MKFYLNDVHCRKALFPFTVNRHTADIRIGILTIREKWELLGFKMAAITGVPEDKDAVQIAANLIPTLHNYKCILEAAEEKKEIPVTEEVQVISYPWQIHQFNDTAIRHDFELRTKDRKSAQLSDT